MRFILLIYFLIPCFVSVRSQVTPENRYPKQVCFEDSSRVFWTWYPNPFCPPTVGDTGRGLICGGLTFYCDLSDSVGVAFVEKNDSIVYTATVKTATPPHFSLCYWLAGPHVRTQSLPARYFRSNSDEQLKLLLIVHGRRKSLLKGPPIQRGWYYWMDERRPKNR